MGAAYARLAPRAWWGDRLSILIYHRVHRGHDAFTRDDVDASTFDWQLEVLSRYFKVLPLSSAVTRLYNGEPLPRGAVAARATPGSAVASSIESGN